MSQPPVPARTDKRVVRTKAMLADALITMARERQLSEITVADITERAEVKRSTFYQHYRDIETLLADALDAKAAAVGVELVGLDPTSLSSEPPIQLQQYFAHIDENAGLYRMALGPEGSMVTLTRLMNRAMLLILGEDAVGGDSGATACHPRDTRATDGSSVDYDGESSAAATEPHLPREIAAAGLAGALVGVLQHWLQTDPRPSSSQACGWVWTLATGWARQWA